MESLKSIYNLKNIKSKEDILNKLIEEPNALERKYLSINLSKLKLKDANPYYSFLGYLNDVTSCAKEIIDINMEMDNTSKEEDVLCSTTDDDIKYFISNNIYFIKKHVGGHRNPGENDNEIAIDIYVKNLCNIDELHKKIKVICDKYSVEYKVLCKVEV